MEHWLEVNIAIPKLSPEQVVQVLQPLLDMLLLHGISWHFLYEARGWLGDDNTVLPHLRFRVETENEKDKLLTKEQITSYLKERNLTHYFGRHGRRDEEYIGEVDRFGEEGWLLTKQLLEVCSSIALELETEKTHGPRFCRADLLHLICNILGRQNFVIAEPINVILLKKTDLPTKTVWEGA